MWESGYNKMLQGEDVAVEMDFLKESVWNENVLQGRTGGYPGGKGVCENTVWLWPQKWQASNPSFTLRGIEFACSVARSLKFKNLHKIWFSDTYYWHSLLQIRRLGNQKLELDGSFLLRWGIWVWFWGPSLPQCIVPVPSVWGYLSPRWQRFSF